MNIAIRNNKYKMITLQLIGWGVILASTIFWSALSGSSTLDLFGISIFAINIITLIFIYILNYTIFIPRYLFQDHRKRFLFVNIILISALITLSYYINESGVLNMLRPENMPPRRTQNYMYLTRDVITYILMIGLVTAFRLAERLELSEKALKEAESARVKAELANLRSQINPHFLLNTLNNIYALTAIDTERAQKTIKELSQLLRYILYDNLNERVSLSGEVEFLKSYIELMSIRLPRQVRLTTEFRVSDDSTTLIAPLIFISLVENAFKHSVGADGSGFIEIEFEECVERAEIVLSIKNSNNAKADEDKSGHGIGLEQVRRRLELLYPNNNYSWEVKQERDVYSSILTLKITQENG